MTSEEISAKAKALKQRLQRRFVMDPREGIEILDLVEELADRVSEHTRGAGHDSFGGEG